MMLLATYSTTMKSSQAKAFPAPVWEGAGVGSTADNSPKYSEKSFSQKGITLLLRFTPPLTPPLKGAGKADA